jgi:hypothetical protein
MFLSDPDNQNNETPSKPTLFAILLVGLGLLGVCSIPLGIAAVFFAWAFKLITG